MKEKAWKKSGGNCHSSLNSISSGDISKNFIDKKCMWEEDIEVSFYWRIFPSLELVLLCNECAELDDLLDSDLPSSESRSRKEFYRRSKRCSLDKGPG